MRIHIVQKGDTLWKIAKKYNVDFAQLKSLNSHLSDPNMIMPGMKIKVPSSSHSPGKKHHKEMPIKEAPVKEAPQPIPAPPPMPKLPKYPGHEESPEFLPPMPEAELPIETPSMPLPMPMPPPMPIHHKPMHHMQMSPCGCAPIMPMPCQPVHWPGHPSHHHGYGNMMPPMGVTEEESSSSSYDTYYENSLMHGSHTQVPMHESYGQSQDMYGQQMPIHGQHQGMYGQQMPLHGQHQGMYGQQMPMYGQHQSMYGQQIPMYGQQQGMYSQEMPMYGQQMPAQHYEQMYGGPSVMPPQMSYDQHTMPVPSYQAPLFTDYGEAPDMLYRETDEENEEDEED